jgi:hypothetical protein
VTDQDLKTTLARVEKMGACKCLVCALRTIPLDPRGLQPPAPKKPRAKRGQSLKAYMDAERGAR